MPLVWAPNLLPVEAALLVLLFGLITFLLRFVSCRCLWLSVGVHLRNINAIPQVIPTSSFCFFVPLCTSPHPDLAVRELSFSLSLCVCCVCHILFLFSHPLQSDATWVQICSGLLNSLSVFFAVKLLARGAALWTLGYIETKPTEAQSVRNQQHIFKVWSSLQCHFLFFFFAWARETFQH